MNGLEQARPSETKSVAFDSEQLAAKEVRRMSKAAQEVRRKSKMLQRSSHGRLNIHKVNYGIPSQFGALEHVWEKFGDDWHLKILHFLHQKKIQYMLMFFLLLDVLILFTELFLMAEYPRCMIIERNCISCCEASSNSSSYLEEDLRFLKGEKDGDDHGHSEVCDAGLDPNYDTGGCDPHAHEMIHHLEIGLFYCTIFILTVFFVELNLEMIALGPGVFFKQFFYALDYVVVTVSLTVDLALFFVDEEVLATLVGIIVFARVWRFVRIGHGIVEVTSELTHQRYEELGEYTLALEALVEKQHLEMPKASFAVRQVLEQLHHEEEHHSHPQPEHEEEDTEPATSSPNLVLTD